MKDQSDEQISSLVDGELDGGDTRAHADFLFDAVTENDELRRCWGRYHLIGDALRRNLPDAIDMQLSSRVMAALKDEPTILAPPPPRVTVPFGRRVTGLAVAASVTVIAVLGAQFLYKEDGAVPAQQFAQVPVESEFMRAGTAIATAPANANATVQTVTQTRSQFFNQSLKPVTPSQFVAKYPLSALNKYFVDHNQQTTRVVQGMMPYARIITNSHSPLPQRLPEQARQQVQR